MSDMKKKARLVAYELDVPVSDIVPAPIDRVWMDKTPDRFAYRCLPLNIANACGWQVLSPVGFEAVWNGSPDIKAIQIRIFDQGYPPPVSHFGSGVLTFHINFLFRTEEREQLLVTGPINNPKDGIQALSGVIETDWSHYTFTMNWIFTCPNKIIRFEKGEPICQILPLSLDRLERYEPEIINLQSESPDMFKAYKDWTESRNNFNKGLATGDEEALKLKWQRAYFKGLNRHDQIEPEHRTKLSLNPFKRQNKDPFKTD
jgi:hypothetical protein